MYVDVLAFVYRIPDLTLSSRHPKRVFMRRAVEFEIRLSYFDRVLKTLPEPMQSGDAGVMPAEAPGPDFDYDDPGNQISFLTSRFSDMSLLQASRSMTQPSLS